MVQVFIVTFTFKRSLSSEPRCVPLLSEADPEFLFSSMLWTSSHCPQSQDAFLYYQRQIQNFHFCQRFEQGVTVLRAKTHSFIIRGRSRIFILVNTLNPRQWLIHGGDAEWPPSSGPNLFHFQTVFGKNKRQNNRLVHPPHELEAPYSKEIVNPPRFF